MTEPQTTTVDVASELADRAKLALWQRGNLRYKLHATQLKILLAINRTDSRRFFVLCSRRLGKTFLLSTMAVQTCISRPNARVVYLAPYAKDAQEISLDTLGIILQDCPAQFKPEWKEKAREFVFPNGSILRIKGVNGEHAQYLRGGSADLVILDECGLMDDLTHVVQDVCMPMTLTTDGLIVMATTPPRSPGHDSALQYEKLARKGATATFTLRDAPHINDYAKIEYLVESGEDEEHARKCIEENAWPKGTTARREYFCEFVTDASSAVVPEFTKEREAEIVREWSLPDYYDAYLSMDPGFNDRTGILFAYWDFVNYKLVVQDEALLEQANTATIAHAIASRESALWGRPPFLRVSDVDLRLQADLHQMHGLQVVSVRKEDSVGAINLMRNMIQSGIVIIHPRCGNLIRQLHNAIWNTKGTDFAKGNKIDGHYDLVAALKYLCRSIVREKNPYPDWWTLPGGPHAPKHISPQRYYAQKKTEDSKKSLYGNTPTAKRLLRRKK